jgi:hypothetical protein
MTYSKMETETKNDYRAMALKVIDLESENVTDGNIAAHLIHLISGDSLGGIEIGWKGMESTSALSSIFDSTIDAFENDGFTYWEDMAGEIVESAVPIHTADIFQVAQELRNYADSDEVKLYLGDLDRIDDLFEASALATVRQVLNTVAGALGYGINDEIEKTIEVSAQ